ncbi:MAG: caspase family protein, partial [Candidatus Obscuribacterales bacterium]|nr:caspase family protein [Candidatus Obscuribacterales bacterium]
MIAKITKIKSTTLSLLLIATTVLSASLAPCQAARAEKSTQAQSPDTRESKQAEAQEKVLAAVKRPIKDKWAVVIGVDRFVDPRIPHLRFSSKDAKDFARFLVDKANFAKDHVLLLLNEDATQRNINSAIGDLWLPRRVLD